MRVVGRINKDQFNSRKTATIKELQTMFEVAPNLAAKTIRLFPHYAMSFFTEGLGEIYDVNNPGKNVEGLNNYAYKWKLKGHEFPIVKMGTRVTGGAVSAGSTVGAGGASFIVAFDSSYYNPRDIVRLENGQQIFIISEPTFQSTTNSFEYTAVVNGNDPTEAIITDYLVAGKETGTVGNQYPELSDKGYMSFGKSAEWHVNYLTKSRYDWTFSADAASTMFVIEDVINYQGKPRKVRYITDELFYQAMNKYHLDKEMKLIYGKSTMDSTGKCFKQDEKGQDIIAGDGLIEQIADSQKQNYTQLSLDLFEDILSDMSKRMPNPTGNTIVCTTGREGYKSVGRILRAEHKGFWNHVPSPYVNTVNGKIRLGAEYDAYTFQGNTIVFNVNRVFDHPNNPSKRDSNGNKLESSKFLFIDTSNQDGVKNIQMIAKKGRSFITGDVDGVGGQDGMTSGKASTPVDGSQRVIIGTCGMVLHNPYSSYMLEKITI